MLIELRVHRSLNIRHNASYIGKFGIENYTMKLLEEKVCISMF